MKLGDLADLYLPHIEKLLSDSEGVTYVAMHVTPDPESLNQFPKSELTGAMVRIQQAYILSLLERCHLASLTSIARLHSWLTATLKMEAAKNALGFAACLRGYIEAGADAHDVMNFVPGSLIKAGSYLYAMLNRPELLTRTAVGFGELEQKLIHYEFASRPPKNGPVLPDHVAAETTAYIRSYEKSQGISGLEALYAHLCDLTHPARGSVFAFLVEERTNTVFTRSSATQVIDSILNDYGDTLQELVSRSMNVSVLTITMLNMITGLWPSAPSRWVASNPSLADSMKRLAAKIDVASRAGVTEDEIRASLR